MSRLGPGSKYFIYTYGCQMNERDTEIIAGFLEEMGYVPAEKPEAADLVLFNTCAIRETAEQHVYGEIGRLKAVKDERPDLVIGLCGCMAQEKETVEWIQRHAPHVNLIFGTHNIHELPDILARAADTDQLVVDVWKSAGDEVVENLPSKRLDGVKAWVNIIYGCDKYCTYCIVPYTRGRERSRRPEDILREIRALALQGYKEVTLLGQNVNAYGRDLGTGYDLADLLADVQKIDGIRWVRYLTSHPWQFTQKLIDAVAANDKVCEHFHLPVQSGNNRILRKMNRHYTREEYLDLIRRIREAIPNASITTDIIVGFPGETEEEFQDTLRLVEEVGFDNAFTFIYSPRPGTPAAVWNRRDPTSLQEKKERLQRLNELQYSLQRKKNERLVGQRMEVLVEGPSKKNPAKLSARTRTNRIVLLPFEDGLQGRFCEVEITRAHTWYLEGRRTGEPLPDGRRSRIAVYN
ncbi:MAG: tRNA (N6-isopentenyl adenosine(37)-C2)-methylthiotransferase MiaB [Clostridia bacterium]|nr:tRNA (N6-isopentenyl adenosine(37)-C2)-methylthiotransferase MiaB [Clostridia bacterium]